MKFLLACFPSLKEKVLICESICYCMGQGVLWAVTLCWHFSRLL